MIRYMVYMTHTDLLLRLLTKVWIPTGPLTNLQLNRMSVESADATQGRGKLAVIVDLVTPADDVYDHGTSTTRED